MLNEVLDDFSVDSTTWLLAGRYGLLIDENGKQIAISSIGRFSFSTAECLSQNVRTMNKWLQQESNKNLVISQQLAMF